MITTRAQRAAIYRLFARYYTGLEQDLARYPLRLFPNRAWRSLYREYRKRFQMNGFGSDRYLFGQPYQTGDGQLYVGIEADGYTHS